MLTPPVRRRLKHEYVRALAAARVERIMAQVHARSERVLILNLHRVSPDPNPFWPPLHPDAFRGLVAFVAGRCRVCRFAELADPTTDRRPVAVLSFDDGCRDFVEYAMPILDEFDLPANHNVIGHAVRTGEPPFAIRVPDALNAVSVARLRGIRIEGFARRLEGDDDLARTRFGTALCAYLKELPPARRARVWSPVQALFEEAGTASWTRMMDQADVAAVAEAGHEVGSHSFSHESMAHLSAGEFEADLDLSDALFAELGLPVDIYAFPNGSYRPGQIDVLLRRGIDHVLTIGRPSRARTGVHPRQSIYGDTPAELRLRAVGVV